MHMASELNNQVVGNVGLYYVCYRLSLLGWNVMPTARNARGVDIVIYNQDASRTHTIQVKALSRHSPVPLGGKIERLFGDFFVICRNVSSEVPECFILTPAEVRQLAHRGEKDGVTSYWLQPKQYENDEFREQWQRIGQGAPKPMSHSKPTGLFVTYENYRNPHVTIHLAGCRQIAKRGGRHKHDQGEYHNHGTYPEASTHAQSTGLPVKDCSFCKPKPAGGGGELQFGIKEVA
jgi:hypothetical protein